MEIKREHHINFWYVIAAFLGVLMIQSLLFQPTHVKTIPYSEFLKLVDQDKVTNLVIGATQITGTFREPEDKGIPHFATNRVDPGLAQILAKAKLTFSGESGPGLLQAVLGWILPVVGFVLVWMFLIRPMAIGQGAGGLMAIGKSKAKVFVECGYLRQSQTGPTFLLVVKNGSKIRRATSADMPCPLSLTRTRT